MGSEKLDDTDGLLAEQVAVNTDNITRLFAEQERQREKLHTLESDRATVLLLAQKVDDLARQLPTMVGEAAERAARRVAEAAQLAAANRETTGRDELRTWAALVSSLVAVATLLYLVFHQRMLG